MMIYDSSLEKLKILHSNVMILLLLIEIISCSSQLTFSFLFLEKKLLLPSQEHGNAI